MRTKSFRDLLVWQRSMRLAETVYIATREFPREETFGLTSQMRRSAVSVPSNIAEGQGRDSDRSFALFLSQARGSLYELETQAELARNLGLLDVDRASAVLAEAAEIGRMIHGLSGALHSTERATR
jgi:four helix bundle protein